MQYAIFVSDDTDDQVLHTGPVPDSDAAYLKRAAEHLRPLSDEQYISGPAAILHAMAKSSYVLDGNELYWCSEWVPGLVIVKMKPEGEMQWVALRSPIPGFGGREPLPEDDEYEQYDEDHNPQYNLIFTPWDAQFDEDEREDGSFARADVAIQRCFEDCRARARALEQVIESRYSGSRDSWLKLCQQNFSQWCGDGIRLSLLL